MQLRLVLGQPSVAHLYVPELALDHPKRVFDLGTDACLGLLKLVQYRVHRRARIQHLALARSHRHVPVDLDVLCFNALAYALVARVGKDVGFLSVHQRVCLRHVVDVGRCAHHRVHQARIHIDSNVRHHPEVPLVALLGLVHLGVSFTAAVLGRTRGSDQRGIDHRAALEQQALGRQRGVDGGQDLQAQVMGFEQVAKAQDRALIGQVVFARIQARELAKHGGVVQRFFHRRVREVEPLLDEVMRSMVSTANGGRPPLAPGAGA